MQRVGQTQNKRKPHPIAQRLLASPLRFATQAVAIMQSKTMKLNPQQQAAVEYLGGALFVLAGAGSGKTRVITEKIAYMITQAGYKPHHIAAITFTNKAAREMGERVRALLGKEARGLHISTFHRLGLDILQKEHLAAGLRRNFTVFDARDGATLVKELSKQEDEAMVRQLQAQISAYKNANISAAAAKSLAQDEAQVLAAHIYHHYDQRLRAYNAVDFDDLIALPLALLREHEAVRERWQHRVRYLLVDEYQDTNDCQYALLQLLAGAGAAFTAVGDDDQSIYAWRGARPENIAHLHEDYPALKTVKLEQNYRCHQQILAAANTLIANNPHVVEKKLWSELTAGEGVHVICARSDEAEAEQIVQDIYLRKIRDNKKNGDFAILYRSNFQARQFEQQLRELSLPYKISGGTSFFEHSEIRDLLGYLRLINNPDDDAAFLHEALLADARAWESTYGRGRDVTGLACERNVLRYRPATAGGRAEPGTSPADLVRVLAAGVLAGGTIGLSLAEQPSAGLRGALLDAGVDVDVEAPAVWEARLADLGASGELGLRVRIIGPRHQSGAERWREASRATSGSPDVALYTGAVTGNPHSELLPFVREQSVTVTAHRFGTPLDLAAGLL